MVPTSCYHSHHPCISTPNVCAVGGEGRAGFSTKGSLNKERERERERNNNVSHQRECQGACYTRGYASSTRIHALFDSQRRLRFNCWQQLRNCRGGAGPRTDRWCAFSPTVFLRETARELECSAVPSSYRCTPRVKISNTMRGFALWSRVLRFKYVTDRVTCCGGGTQKNAPTTEVGVR